MTNYTLLMTEHTRFIQNKYLTVPCLMKLYSTVTQVLPLSYICEVAKGVLGHEYGDQYYYAFKIIIIEIGLVKM